VARGGNGRGTPFEIANAIAERRLSAKEAWYGNPHKDTEDMNGYLRMLVQLASSWSPGADRMSTS